MSENTQLLPADDALRIGNVGKKDEQGNWTWETKVEVATQLLVTGNAREVSRKTGVNFDTIRVWKKAEWWPKLIEEVKEAQRAELSSKLGRIVNRALEKVEDRLENGDFILNNKTGEILRKPVSIKEANKVLTDAITSQINIEKSAQTGTTETQSTTELLKTLAIEFAKFNRKVEKNNATDIAFKEVEHAIHDQRQTGLQKGSS